MKLLLNSAILFFLCLGALAQDELLPLDDRGKFIHYEVVTLPDADHKVLQSRANSFFAKKNSPVKLKGKEADSAFNGTGKLIINKTVLVMAHPSGEVQYEFRAEIRDHKYRFWLTDFKFIPYMRDRYSNYVPSTTVGVPLEDSPGKLNATQWKEYQLQTAKYAKELAGKFKEHMSNPSPVAAPAPQKKVVKKEW